MQSLITMGMKSETGDEQAQSAPKLGNTQDKESYMDLDVSSQRQNTIYQGLVNPDDLKTKDDYLRLDDVSRQESTTYQGLVNPDDLKMEDKYLGLDDATRQESTTYQGLVNPDDLKVEDKYLRLDDASRKMETEYQSLNNTQKDKTYYEDDDLYNEIPDANPNQKDRQMKELHVPTPPLVKGVDLSDSKYVNVKEAHANVRP